MDLKEIYSRIIDLALKVYRGEVDPLSVDTTHFINMLKKVDVDKLSLELAYMDINAIHGLSMILEAQSRVIKEKTKGLYIDRLLTKLNLLKMSIHELAEAMRVSWRPVTELSYLDIEEIWKAKLYFESRKMIRYTPPVEPKYRVPPPQYYIEERVSEGMNKLYKELIDKHGYSWVDYYRFIKEGDMLYRAYILSFLITSGYVIMKVDRIRKRISIKACKKPVKYLKPASIPVVLKGGGK